MYEELIKKAETLAKAVGAPVLFGVRHAGSTPLFAHCDGIESDGSTFEDAFNGVLHEHISKAKSKLIKAKRELRDADDIVALESLVQ